jgi:putative N6-adenine-specific DNA methylase
MTKFFATCARGLETVLFRELEGIGATQIETGRGGVFFSGGIVELYKANLWLRTAVRVLRPVFDGPVFSTDELYDAVRTINWADYLTPNHTLAVDCNVRDSNITHSQYASRRVKDAICDQFRETTGVRPSVDTERPMLGLNLHVSKNRAILSLDSSWDSLHKRGYRPIQTRAPLNESLAAGLLLHLGYDGTFPLVDWMCGSGTFLVEGAWIAMRRPPGLTRKWFSFFGGLDFDKSLWGDIRDTAREEVATTLAFPPRGSDVRADAVELAQHNAKGAGIGHLVTVKKLELADAKPLPGEPPGIVICNPPYGERLGDEDEWIPLHRKMGAAFAENWPGWRLALFTASDKLAKQLKLKVVRTTHFYNGSLPCKLWEFV